MDMWHPASLCEVTEDCQAFRRFLKQPSWYNWKRILVKVQFVESRIPPQQKTLFASSATQEIPHKLVQTLHRRNVSVVCARCMGFLLNQLVCWYMFHAATCSISEVGFSGLRLRPDLLFCFQILWILGIFWHIQYVESLSKRYPKVVNNQFQP